jgi:tetratricopeptide (TPR) repeat protein
MIKNTVAAADSSKRAAITNSRTRHELWQVPLFLLGGTALILVAALGPLLTGSTDNKLERDLATIREALEKSGAPAADIVSLAESCVNHSNQQSDRVVATAHYLLGTAYLRQSQFSTGDKAHDELNKGLMQLELAELRGVSAADQPRLTYLRGKALYLANGDLGRIIDLLGTSLPTGADNPSEGYGILVQANLRKAVPDLDAALAANFKQIEFCDDEPGLVQARLERGELLLRMDKRLDAIKVLEQAAVKAQPKQRLRIRMLQARSAMEEGMWGRAIPWWKELLSADQFGVGSKGRILYNLGLCCFSFEPPNHEKEAVAAWQETLLYGGDEAQAAALRLGGPPTNRRSNFLAERSIKSMRRLITKTVWSTSARPGS